MTAMRLHNSIDSISAVPEIQGGSRKEASLPAEDASMRRKIVGAAQTQTSAQDRTGAHGGTADTDDDAQCERDDPRGIRGWDSSRWTEVVRDQYALFVRVRGRQRG